MELMQHGEHSGHEQSGHEHSGHEHSGHEQSGHGGHGGHAMSDEQRHQMLRMHHKKTLWIYWSLILLAVWLISSPFTFGYLNEELWVDPSGGRGVWFSDQTHTELRAQLMAASDVLSGLVLLVLGWRSLRPNRPVSLWGCCFVGVWLTLAPIVFWAPTAGAYLNDTIIGAWIIALTILIPGMPNMIMYMQMGPDSPPGWTYNPSSWPQRWIMISLAFAGWLVSRYLAAFQLGYIDYVWDPLVGFSQGTKKVLNSSMSHSWPISDGGLGAISYTFEFLMGFMGSSARWRTMPWMVAFFGILVIPLGLAHVILVISQPVLVHHWCALCLLAAAIMLPMIPLQADEVIAMFQHVKQAHRRGDRGGSWWKLFWKGGTAEGCEEDQRSPELVEFAEQPGNVVKASLWGMSFPWTLSGATLAGVALMLTPTFFGIGIQSLAADIGHLGGALIVTVAVIAMGEVVRIGRYLNVLIGLIVAGGVWFTDEASTGYAATATGLAIAAILLSLPRGQVRERYGAWDAYVR
ncbi:vitamin K epoxide reductase family protein [Candidatus Laterigemmans baculatus]|uniref:vitamin K epoxide reductase family protein n=1 Tax=Candidatus Laterigemmans baculatus TaxID=2770505 RepID=UPI001F2BD9A7|nr:vitamin K epoxide reductase family protein [Candidatus Laterigemmans baculatus]